ncbi:hypothetical protein BU25DRAFT_422093 [Macroventuria anomochaeta]|uniref:Uncharacterized protein n=1 Tax=Macroventuria anomochaeta TaxID=301207 RepID=A0ACB6RZM9_9PLEO|nr:uncharacterized protein BU25DRAFT_422093 [Macroventuria anomochaeta]KAF2627229.1 hypothetical protein BU25DRAFT_422093 [Macroventuria anomochaeta]
MPGYHDMIDAEIDSRPCYYTYNHVQPGYYPCYPPSVKAISHCCGIGSTCLGDTLCLSSDGPMYIGSCTAKDWFNSTTIPSGCPKYYKYCEGKIGDDITITICDVKPDKTWEACCGAGQGAASCCSSDKFTIGNLTHEYAVQRPWNMDNISIPSLLPTGPYLSATSTPSSTTCDLPDLRSSSTQRAQIGVSAGLGASLLVTLGLLFLERRKRRQAEARTTQQELYPPFGQQELRRDTLCSYEVDANSPTVELSSQRPVQELPH